MQALYYTSNNCSGVSPFNNSSRLALSTVLVAFLLLSNLLHSDTLQFVKLHPVITMFGMLVLL